MRNFADYFYKWANETSKVIIFVICHLSFMASPALAQEQGKASYYSKKMQGRKMSSGLRYHNDSMFCAHRKYPFGTLLKVVNLRNDKSVIVKVTDRGPYGRGRVIDLSYGAARELGMLSAGVAMVTVTPYVEEKGVPYKPGSYSFDFPEIDYEITEDDDGLTPEWKDYNNQKHEATDSVNSLPHRMNPK